MIEKGDALMERLGKRNLYKLASKQLLERENLAMPPMKACTYSYYGDSELLVFPFDDDKRDAQVKTRYGGEYMNYRIFDGYTCVKESGWFDVDEVNDYIFRKAFGV